jgi:TPP-dependent indolepyruvate ferredoxin oxidoreductase alpha subunit
MSFHRENKIYFIILCQKTPKQIALFKPSFVALNIFRSVLFIIRFHKDNCNRCNICVKKSPCLAVESILAEKRIRLDCYAFGKRIEVCPTGALKFRIKEI